METDPAAVVRSASALINEDPEVAASFLLAAVYVRAIKTGETPQDIVDALFTAVPSSEVWPSLRAALLSVLEDGAGDPA